jgi:hypothetical protein
MVFIFQPIMMSYLLPPKPRKVARRRALAQRRRMQQMADPLVMFPLAFGAARGWALGAVGLLIVTGLIAGLRAKIGYSQPGTPLYRQGAKVNRDIDAVRRVFPLDEGWVIIRAREDPKAILREVGNILSPEAIRVQRDLVNYLMLEDVDRVISVVPDIIETVQPDVSLRRAQVSNDSHDYRRRLRVVHTFYDGHGAR